MEPIFEKIKRSNHLPQLPQVMLELVKACGRDNTDVDELVRIISTDPSLTAKVLQIISSPYVNLPREVSSVKTAVVYLGLDTIRNIAISSSAMHFFRMSKVLPDFDITRFWFHSYTCGVIAQKLASESGLADPGVFFMAGLLHDVGRLVLMKNFPREYAGILAEAKNGGGALCEAEAGRFKVDALQVSSWLFSRWHLDPVASDAVLFVGEPPDRIREELPHVRILYAANALARSNARVSHQEAGDLVGLSGSRVEKIVSDAEADVIAMADHLGIVRDVPDSAGRADREIGLEIKDMSVFFGTLSTLMSAGDAPAVLHAVQKGFEIIFHVPRIFFFLLDRNLNILTGTCSPEDRHCGIVQSIAIPLDSPSSIVAEAASHNRVINGFLREQLAVSDRQILRHLSTEGLYCIPVTARKKSLGAMVLGVDRPLAGQLDRNLGVIQLFSRQTGICLENISFHESYAMDVNEKKMDAYATLTDRVVHEVNNPLSIVKNYLETLQIKLPDRHPAQEELSLVGEELSRISGLLSELGSFSRPRVGGGDYWMDVNQTCSRVITVLNKSMLMHRNIQARMNGGTIPEVKMNGDGLKQILINLVKNAAEAMETGGEIVVTTAVVPGSSRVMIDEKKKIPGWVKISIRDNGPGIPDPIRERIFEPYNSGKGEGHSGLGLAIVHSVVREMNGRISWESREGEGTTFSVFLPMTPRTGSGSDVKG